MWKIKRQYIIAEVISPGIEAVGTFNGLHEVAANLRQALISDLDVIGVQIQIFQVS